MLRSAATALAIALSLPASAPASELQPYQMVRSLQLVQDRLADGDHAALPMQRKLLEMIDGRMLRAEPAEFEDARNFRALLIYAMSGGNPATIRTLSSRLDVTPDMKTLADAVSDYVNGRTGPAVAGFETIDPLAWPPELGAFLALIRGTVKATEEPAQAHRNLDQARLLAPGTLIEEAALRRLLALHAQTGDAPAFQLAAMQYVTRFLRSPYATQFAEAYVEGVMKLHATIAISSVEETTSMMNEEQAKVIYLRIARRSAIEGHAELLAFASRMARRWADGEGEADPRAQLYANLGAITSTNVGDVLAQLKAIDRSRLSPDDRAFLNAAEAIAASVVSRPAAIEVTAVPLPSPPVPEPTAAESDKPAPAPQGAVAELIDDGRARIEAIDQLLQETVH